MHTFIRVLVVVPMLLGTSLATAQKQSAFLEHAAIQRAGGLVSAVAVDPRPLLQMIDGISQEYGWSIDYEDPPYQSSLDLAETSNPKWKAANPNGPVFKLVRGGKFRTTYSESPAIAVSGKERAALVRKVVGEYNASGNPGQFTVRESADGRLEIVGTSVKSESGAKLPTTSILDTPVMVEAGSKSAIDAVVAILKAVTAKTGRQVGIGIIPDNLMVRTQVSLSGVEMPARDALHQVLSQTKRQLYWRLLYDAGMQAYFFSVLQASRVEYDTFGARRLKAVR